MRRHAGLGIALAFALTPAARAAAPVVLDPFEEPGTWIAAPASGVQLELTTASGVEGRSLCLEIDFQGRGGYAVAKRSLPVTLPENFELSFFLRGEIPANNLELKLVDRSGENVWWVHRRDVAFPREWTEVTYKKRHVEFAWGPDRDAELKEIAAIEFAVTAGEGGRGRVCIDQLTLTPLPPPRPYAGTPQTAWERAAEGRSATLTIDYGEPREFGGLTIDWEQDRWPRRFAIDLSDDGRTWTEARPQGPGKAGRSRAFLPESEARFVRLRLADPAGDGFGVAAVMVEPLELGAYPNAFFQAIAREAPRGRYPRGLTGEMVYWTVVGVDGAREEVLLTEDGAFEAGKGEFSIEPFLLAEDRLYGWADAESAHALEDGDLPIPTVAWDLGRFALSTTLVADGPPAASRLWARYRVTNRGSREVRATLALALRPLQANPPSQFLNSPGGVAPIRTLAWDGGAVRVDGTPRVFPAEAPTAFGAAAFGEGDVTEFLARGGPPPAPATEDPFGYASGAMTFALDLPAGGSRDVEIAVPLATSAAARPGPDELRRPFDERLAAVAASWRTRLDRVAFTVPRAAQPLVDTLRSQLAFILINRDGAGIQPGSRSYERSWIRDGALTGEVLLRLGHAESARAFADWFAGFQYPDGKVPCCVDARGADPVPENDSHGQLIFLVTEVYRYTGDRAFAARLWPAVAGAVDYIDALRQRRRTEVYRAPEALPYFGLLPESISHEGYSDKPRHSYWDDIFALRGLDDAAFLASALGRREDAARIGRIAAEFRADFLASVERTLALHGIDYLPGCVELGDFDPTSSTVALAPGGLEFSLPPGLLERTFERYWEEAVARRDGRKEWVNYTPYELRSVGALVRLGERDRAHALLSFFMNDRRPAGWNGWAEVVWRDPRAAKFIGDMPHTWVGSDFARSFLDFFAYERRGDRSLVLAAGIPEAWAQDPGGVAVSGLSTPYGPLDLSLRPEGEALRVRVAGLTAIPPGGLLLASPFDRGLREVTVDGRPAGFSSRGEIVVPAVPAEIVLR